MRKKLLIATVLVVSLIFILGVSGAAKPLYYKIYPTVNILVNGKEIVPAAGDVPAFQIDGRTMVPIRLVAEALKADVKWDEQTRTVIITKEEYIPPAPAPVVKEDLIDIKDITFNTSATRITGQVTNKNKEDVDLKFTINCYGRNETYLGHVHVYLEDFESEETRIFQVESESELKPTNFFRPQIDSIEVH